MKVIPHGIFCFWLGSSNLVEQGVEAARVVSSNLTLATILKEYLFAA